jgi:exocyst complex component 4
VQADPSLPEKRFSRYLTSLSVKPSQQVDEPDANPEADTFGYMETLLEALAVMGRLGGALDVVAQRVPAELHSLVETTLDEVEERLGLCDCADSRSERIEDAPVETKVARLDAAGPPRYALILKDLFWTLYSKLGAVLESHRAIYEIARWISSVSLPWRA